MGPMCQTDSLRYGAHIVSTSPLKRMYFDPSMPRCLATKSDLWRANASPPTAGKRKRHRSAEPMEGGLSLRVVISRSRSAMRNRLADGISENAIATSSGKSANATSPAST